MKLSLQAASRRRGNLWREKKQKNKIPFINKLNFA